MSMSKRQFEAENETTATATTAEASSEKTTAVAATTSRAVARPNLVASNPLASLKEAMKVEYNTLEGLAVNQGNFVLRSKDEPIGDTITVELLSYQSTFICAPNDRDAPKDLVKYGNTHPIDSDGVPLTEHLAFLKDQGYDKADIRERTTLVLAMTGCAKSPKLEGNLFQLDLPPTSKAAFDRYMFTSAYRVSKGLLNPADAVNIKLNCVLAKGQGTDKYTLCEFAGA
jgi:hypothetical protein